MKRTRKRATRPTNTCRPLATDKLESVQGGVICWVLQPTACVSDESYMNYEKDQKS